jgi:hypothetical protein
VHAAFLWGGFFILTCLRVGTTCCHAIPPRARCAATTYTVI